MGRRARFDLAGRLGGTELRRTRSSLRPPSPAVDGWPFLLAGSGVGRLPGGSAEVGSVTCTCATPRPGPGLRPAVPRDPDSGDHGGGGGTAVASGAPRPVVGGVSARPSMKPPGRWWTAGTLRTRPASGADVPGAACRPALPLAGSESGGPGCRDDGATPDSRCPGGGSSGMAGDDGVGVGASREETGRGHELEFCRAPW
jgi:hypothetical protein